MNQQLWIALLTFLAAVISLASQTLPIPSTMTPWLIFAVGVINLALAIFFGVNGYRARQANKVK